MSKPPPHSNLAERQALMQLIAHGEEQVSILLQTEDFYDESHRKIFEAAKEAIEKIGTPDFVYITEKLKTNSRIGEIAPEMVASICDEPYRGPPDGAINTIKRARIARETVQMYRSLAGKNVEELPALLLEHHQHITRLLPERRSQRREELLRAIQDPIPRTPTGFPTFDYINKGGLADGTITIISARPGVGKTTLAANIAINLVTNDVPILFLSLEMSAAEVATRMLCALYSNTEEEIRPKAKEVLEGIKTDFDIRDDVISLPAIAQTIYQSPSKVVFIDYLNLIDVPGGDNWLQSLEQASRTLKIIANKTQKPLVVMHQMNRNIEQEKRRQPLLSDLRGAGEQDADVVTFLTPAESTTTTAQALEGTAETMDWLIKKNRRGQTGTVNISFDKPRYHIEEQEIVPEQPKTEPGIPPNIVQTQIEKTTGT